MEARLSHCGLDTLPGVLTWPCERWVHWWHSEGTGAPHPAPLTHLASGEGIRKKYETSPSSLSAERVQSGLGPQGGLLRLALVAKLMILLLVEERLARAEGARKGGPGGSPRRASILTPLGG